jgi:hypothetical protein
MINKPVCPIISGNTKYLGLTQIEWALALFVFLFITFVPTPYSYVGYGVWVLGIFIYPKIAQRYEENFIMVLVEALKIHSTLIGQFRRAIPPYRIQSGSLINKK